MFRFLHTADLHLDSPLRGLRKRPEAPVEAIVGATRKAFDNLVDLALDEEVDFVVIAGDVYDRDWKDYETGLFFRRGMLRLQEAGIRVYLLAGNHDAASVISRRLSLPANVHQFPSRQPATEEPGDLPVALHGMSFPNREVPENLVPDYPAPVVGKFNLGVLHTSLAGAEGHDTYAPCKPADLAGKGYDYWALGHVHQPAIVAQDPWIVYPGCIQGRSVRECGARGCRLVTVDDSLAVSDCRWQELDVVRWAQAAVEITDARTIGEIAARVREAMAGAVGEAGDRLLALRVELTGASPLHGRLHARPDEIEAEIDALADEFGGDRVWVERVRIRTRPLASLEELARRDALTKLVVEAVRQEAPAAALPAEVAAMLAVLPPGLRRELESEWSGAGRRQLYNDACMMILEELKTKGGAE